MKDIFTACHFPIGQDAFGSLVFAFIMHPHFVHWFVRAIRCSQLLQISNRFCAISVSTLPMFLLNRSHGRAGLSGFSVMSAPCCANYTRFGLYYVHVSS